MKISGHVSEHSIYIPSLDKYIHIFGDHHGKYINHCQDSDTDSTEQSQFIGDMIKNYITHHIKTPMFKYPIDLFIENQPIDFGSSNYTSEEPLPRLIDMFSDCGYKRDTCKYPVKYYRIHFSDIRMIRDRLDILKLVSDNVTDKKFGKFLKTVYHTNVRNVKNEFKGAIGKRKDIINNIKYECDVHLFDYFILCSIFSIENCNRVIGYFGYVHAKNIFNIIRKYFGTSSIILTNNNINNKSKPNRCHMVKELFRN